MSESDVTGARANFLARVQRFTDATLERLDESRRGKDADEKEARIISNLVLKILRLWDKAIQYEKQDPRLETELEDTEIHGSGIEEG